MNGHAQHGGTVTIAWDAATPNFIFPLAPATNTDGYNVNLTEQMWPLPGLRRRRRQVDREPAGEPVHARCTYSDGDKTVTIDLKPWNWSDGTPITSRDFTFVYNLLKATTCRTGSATCPGLFPTDVAQRVHARTRTPWC